jgi:iron complex transport system substrate-binding protein
MKNGMCGIAALILAAALFAGMQTGCNGRPETRSRAENSNLMIKTRVITDMTGRQVTIPAPENIRRIAVQTSPQVLNAYAVGVADRLCAVTNAVKKWKLLTKADPRLKEVPATRAGNAQINIEALLQTNPDVCIGSESDVRAIEKSTRLPTLRISMGIPGAYFESVKKEVAFFGSVFGKERRVEIFNAYLDNALEMVKARTGDTLKAKRLRVFMGFDADHLTTYGSDTFMDEWIEAGGCANSARSVQSLGGKEGGLARVSIEQVLGWDPDIIVLDTGNLEDLYRNAVWSKVSAAKNKRIYRLPVGIFLWNRPACESAVLFPQWLACTAYPERFRDFDIKSHAKKFYQDVFTLSFTDDDIDQIFNPRTQSD